MYQLYAKMKTYIGLKYIKLKGGEVKKDIIKNIILAIKNSEYLR